MSSATLAALTAAGVVYDRGDFADPHLDGPTALQVTADGRVRGHLATWDTPHIGLGRRTTPPKSKSGYKYFHQGVVSTKDGDLPVGKLTLGTGHAPVAAGITADAAAAHYDNTGTVAAVVRAGEDDHGIWVSGRLVPGLSDERVDELRRSGISGDWRGIGGQYELVAALAVNVPGFPIPRSEELVAAGCAGLVAAGIVVPPGADLPRNGEEFNAVLASAVAVKVDEVVGGVVDDVVERAVGAAVARERRRSQIADDVAAVVASATADRRARIAAEVERVKAARSCDDVDALTAAADSGIPGHLPHDLKQYWTHGAGLARWASSPHPYTALTRALRSELPAKAQHMVNGLAANLFKATFGIYPGQRKELTAASGRRVRTQEGAQRFGVSVGDLIPEAVAQAQRMGGDFAEAAGNDVARMIDPGRGKGATPKPKSAGGPKKSPVPAKSPTPAAEKPQAKKAAPAKVDAPTPKKGGDTYTLSNPGHPDTKPTTPAKAPSNPVPEPDKPQVKVNSPEIPESSPAPAEKVKDLPHGPDGAPTIPADAPSPRKDAGAGTTGHNMLEDEAPDAGALGGKLLSYSDGRADYDDGSWTDGNAWHIGDGPAEQDPTLVPDSAGDGSAPGDPVTDTDVPPRMDTGAGTDHQMEEDESPETGAHGGQLVAYSDGVAVYDDVTQTDGTAWTYTAPDDPDPLAASAARRAIARIFAPKAPAARH